MVEPVADGDRYYYYAPGEDTPYYVRDPDYGYGYQGGVLVVVYDRHGRPLPDTDASGRWDEGGRYFRRGQDLWRASRGQRHAARRSKLGAFGFGQRLYLTTRNLGRGGGGDLFDWSGGPRAGRLTAAVRTVMIFLASVDWTVSIAFPA